MRLRPLLIALGAASALSISLVAPASAQAADTPDTPKPLSKIVKSADRAVADGDCTITGFSPSSVTVGVKPEAVQFAVSTDCDDSAHSVKWAVTGELYQNSHVGWFGACTYTYAGPAVLKCPDGRATLDLVGGKQFQGNTMAGEQAAYVYAFDDADRNNRDDDTSYDCDDNNQCTKTSSGRDNITGTLELLRATDFGSSFAASAPSVTKGADLTLSGRLSRANWDTGTFDAWGTTAKLQFKAPDESAFRTVRTVPASGDSISTTIDARRSGTFRLSFPGDGESAASVSNAVKVTVTKR
ncbi:hypothetical protein [Kineosporia succinea]|uniref:Neocarzinostatin family protein n=1 Tax=Kineosporia succinea TaxID=84632 RepID=A0ABT9P292_9ACTN|nr:hypothetical protein [Kineosporia succinea]MDP9826789.1 hypothetical protein [Kineosporia succinea]